MKILWVVNIMMPVAAKAFNENISNNSGGWLSGAYSALVKNNQVSISVAFPFNNNCDCIEADGTGFYSFRSPKNDDRAIRKRVNEILDRSDPDLIHIYGTEFLHTFIFQDEAKRRGIKTVISIQGLVSEYAKHFFSDLPLGVCYGKSLRNVYAKDSVNQLRKSLQKKGAHETLAIQSTEHVIGRTIWDYSCVKRINPSVCYHHCEETLRDAFYENEWQYDQCDAHSIIISQCSSPVKGFHYLIEAISVVKEQIPDVKVFVVGKNIMDNDGLKSRFARTHYMNYCRKLIIRNGMSDRFVFLGRLSENQMVQAMLKANIFVLPSSIENSPNSLCEAMILGLPCIASYVGGVQTLVEDNESALTYQHNSVSVLAELILELLQDRKKQAALSTNAKKVAQERHNRSKNAEQLFSIYREICV